MWHKGDEEGLGTTEIFELLDDPLQKALYWIREGARLFDISADNPDACARWISLFGLNPEQWPASHLYSVASLLPSLARLAGTANGVRLALDVILQLPLSGMRPLQAYRYLEEEDLSLLGTRANRLSLDYILSDRFEDAGSFELIIGPVDLESYYKFGEPEGNVLLQQTLRLVMPSYSRWSVAWVVLDPTQYPRLGVARQNSLLGLNTYLGPQEGIGVAVS
jgi:predicted component of type VI protein secretion system